MYTVSFRFEQQERQPVIFRTVPSGYNLLELALKGSTGLRHECGGISACTTCHVYVEKGMDHIEEMNIRERHFIKRVSRHRPVSRLACQSLLLDGKGEIVVTIPDPKN